jgi:hypothetical protein
MKPDVSPPESNTTQQDSFALEAERILFEWIAPIRAQHKHTKDFWLSAIAIAGVIGLVMYFIEQSVMPIILIAALMFLYYVMSAVPAEKVRFAITNKGIRIGDSLTEWPFVGRFWFSYWMGNTLLVFETATFGGRIELVIDEKDRKVIEDTVSAYAPMETTPPVNVDKVATWFSLQMEAKQKSKAK